MNSSFRPPALPKKILLKASGQILTDTETKIFSQESLLRFAEMVQALQGAGSSLALVVGGGNVARGQEISKICHIDRLSADLIGMYATLINGLAVRAALRALGVKAVCFAPPGLIGAKGGGSDASLLTYDNQLAKHLFEEQTVVIIAGGAGNPFFTTDTGAILRALELGAELVVKATKVNGVFSQDPLLHPEAVRYDTIRFRDVIEHRLKVMDQSAFLMAEAHLMPLFIYKYGEPLSPSDAIQNPHYGTLVVP